MVRLPSSPPSDPPALHEGFLRNVDRFPERPALDVEGRVLTYRELYELSAAMGERLTSECGERNGLVGICGGRSAVTYGGILGTLMAGKAVVPLNPTFPPDRLRMLIEESGLEALIVDATTLNRVEGTLAAIDRPIRVILPGGCDAGELEKRWPKHRFVVAAAVNDAWRPRSVSEDAFAYLFFTSGSTGRPKGVGVLHRNTVAFVRMSVERYRDCGLSERDRFSQFYELSFDSSMFDLYVCWAFGGCLCCPSAEQWINPNKYIIEKALTVIDIVPSMGHAMNRRDGWRAGRFPNLRLCRFGGEALSADLCAALASAAPNAVVENVYGPTECTVDACYYRWDRARSMGECEHGMVPIGYPGSHVGVRVVDEHLEEITVGGEGELLISGPQVTPGYWRDAEKTARAFVRIEEGGAVHYRTGDLVRRPEPGRPIVFLGRFDHQIKIAGVRIELGEIEMALREAAETDMVVAVGWPVTPSGASGVVAFAANAHVGVDTILVRLKQKLPSVMVPREIHLLDDFPTNPNGKVDRKALLNRLSSAPPLSASH